MIVNRASTLCVYRWCRASVWFSVDVYDHCTESRSQEWWRSWRCSAQAIQRGTHMHIFTIIVTFFYIRTWSKTCMCVCRSIYSPHGSCMTFCSSSWWSSSCWIWSLVSSLTHLLTWEVRSSGKRRSSRPHVSSAVRWSCTRWSYAQININVPLHVIGDLFFGLPACSPRSGER